MQRLDLPLPQSAPPSHEVLLLIDPVDQFPAQQPQLLPILGTEPGVTVRDISRARLEKEQVLGLLGRARLFIYFGHAQAAAQVPRRYLQTDPHSGLQATDVLTLKTGPRQVLLLACESGLAPDGSGGVAGLGLAQAFLLRGSQSIIATTQKIDANAGKAMAEALSQGGLVGLFDKPALRLRAAQRAVAAGEGRGRPWTRDLAAFRVFVP